MKNKNNNKTSIESCHKTGMARLTAPLSFVLFASLMLASPSYAETTATSLSSTISRALNLAPRIPAETRLIEEGYMTSDQTREQAAIDHANVQPSSTTGLRHLHRNDTQLVETGIQLSRDQDHDGYFSAFSLEMDVDTRDQLEVYADIFLQRRFQSPQLLHSTRSFHLYGNSTSDEYRVDVTLANNFPAGHYDLIIEIRDAWSEELLDSVSEADFRNLGGLPLEDESGWVPRHDDDTVVVEYAGATAPLGLLILALSLIFLRTRSPVTPSTPD